MRIETNDYLTCTNAAQLAGVSRQYMRRLALDGRVRSVVIDSRSRSAILGGMKIDPDLYVTVGHAADIACVSRFWMRQQVQAGKLPGVCMDGIWFVLRSAAEAYERHPSAGRPRVPKPALRKKA